MSREVLAPPLLRMDNNRCYRVNLVHDDFSSQQAIAVQKKGQTKKVYMEEDLYGEDYNDELDVEGDCDIEETSNGNFKLAMHVASSFYGGIIGFKGSTKRRIEAETHCDISIPQKVPANKTSESHIIIKGRTHNSVATARRKIQLLVSSLRKRMKATHFYGVPTNSGDIRSSFNNLKSQIMEAELPGINEELFQSDHALHLTFGTVVLLDDVERKKAVEVLQSCREYLADLKTPFTVKVSGLEIMNDDPSSVRVLYAGVTAEELETFANRCLQRFVQSGLGFNDFGRDSVKLHMTVMNNRYREREIPDSTCKTFDAREILKRWGNFNFGSVQCNELVLCAIGSSRDVKEFYTITGSLKF
ncbi:activating signal cointegrator 1 complex subunit 1 [Stomoxys calcitrans]|uniref:K Homology domain-containing protein n=1 Tax=Stomoxys calcitrans TaxID=35570 RepID=A0A1I8PRX8_STOCA|nr:activating signal cointegrator 1 complex subunit 1 [Stomoxys calcitrans]XP_013108146.1 activating signal cointegrator 1 complex subunit 1 [Stomoxys calcitrans]